MCHVIGTPVVGHPRGGGEGEKLVQHNTRWGSHLDGNPWQVLVHPAGGAVGLFRRAGSAVYRGVDSPKGSIFVQALEPHEVFVLSPVPLIVYP